MEYIVKTISNESEIEACNRAEIDISNWPEKNVYTPKSYAYMGFIPNKGLYYKIVCLESNPHTEVTEYHGMVCADSGVECFLAFKGAEKELSTDVLYMNFEFNSLGNMYAKAAKGRKGRQFLSDEMYKLCNVKAKVEADKWSIEALVPMELLNMYEDVPEMKKGAEFYCNFYKISENPKFEHYVSFTKIGTESPNFHCPQFFAKAVIE